MTKTLLLLLGLSLTVPEVRAQDKSRVASLLMEKLAAFRAETDSLMAAPSAGYAIVLGSKKLDTNDYCFNISPITDAPTLDNIFRNYYFLQDGRPVLLYLNHPSMLYLVAELGARKIDRNNLAEIRAMLPDPGFFLPVIPYLVCCNKYGVVSGEIEWPRHEYYNKFKPGGVPLAYPPQRSR